MFKLLTLIVTLTFSQFICENLTNRHFLFTVPGPSNPSSNTPQRKNSLLPYNPVRPNIEDIPHYQPIIIQMVESGRVDIKHYYKDKKGHYHWKDSAPLGDWKPVKLY